MMNINNRKRHLFRKAYADMYIKEEKYLQKEDCFPAPITGSFYMEKEGYCGMASWLKKQSFEEHAHACELASYIIKRGGKAKLDKVDVVPNDFGTPLEVFEQVYEHECRVSKMIDALVDVAAAEKDKASQDFLWGFVREQVEEEATAAGIVDMVKKAGAAGIFFIDAKLGERK